MVINVDMELIKKIIEIHKKYVEEIFLEIFNTDWLNDYENFLEIAIREQKETFDPSIQINFFLTAEALFYSHWQTFKRICFERKIIIWQEDCLELLHDYIPYKDLWQLIIHDFEFDYFIKCAQNWIDDIIKSFSEDDFEEELSRFEKIKDTIGKKAPKTMKATNQERAEETWGFELPAIIDELICQEIPCDTDELKRAAKIMVRCLHEFQIREIDKHASKLIKKQEKTREIPEEVLLEKAKPQKSAKTTIPAPQIKIDHNEGVVVINGARFALNPKGEGQAILSLKNLCEPEDYEEQIKKLLNIIFSFAEEKGYLKDFLRHVHKLHNYFQKRFNEIPTTNGKFGKDMSSNDNVLTCAAVVALGLMHIRLTDGKVL